MSLIKILYKGIDCPLEHNPEIMSAYEQRYPFKTITAQFKVTGRYRILSIQVENLILITDKNKLKYAEYLI